MTNKEFIDILNAFIPAGSRLSGKGQHGRYKPSKRAYGIYLYTCDRWMFDTEKKAFEEGTHSSQAKLEACRNQLTGV